MKRTNFLYSTKSTTVLFGVLFFVGHLVSCTKNFEMYNTNPVAISDKELNVDFNDIGGFFPQVQKNIYANDPASIVNMQLAQNLTGDQFSGYLALPQMGASNNTTYNLLDAWGSFGYFNFGFNNVMGPINEIKRRGAETSSPDFWAIALILKVEGMHRVTDIYGPIPYSKFGLGGTDAVYDSQHDIYKQFFVELDQAVTLLKAYMTAFPSAKPFAKFDLVYAGDYSRWLKFANSLRLRLAMRLVKVDPSTAKLQAEKAMDANNGGVLTINEENMKVVGPGTVHPLNIFTNVWDCTRMGASMESFLTGYNDPRLSKYFDPSVAFPGKYQGVRGGGFYDPQPSSPAIYTNFSKASTTSFVFETPAQLMTAAEVYLLRAEGALRGWNMGGTAKELYESGVRISLAQWGVGGQADAYLNNSTSKPADYTDPINPIKNSAAATTAITIKWDESVANEQKLERILTQKWIALFPEGQEAWTEFRRTGYPKIFPIVYNTSGGRIDTKIQIRRLNFPVLEYSVNAKEVAKAVQLLGGPDIGGTRLWWDIDKGNF
ncbi:RagB/SusD family nutrient uptake outer membrane protein [Pedobacter sp. MC2016-24]|uniref:RagB/SusD family nutrient uptake outer membrane protein n=1 Tax=Pedobacter sp. MC2016-24 TaxID=2780090 RepID=UPI00187E44B8|nr:RagB/SusD family nutrient uptake outer membrane protein [Pedobacter sp. MC2016-24]MBE9601892.1 SusD/RagB family nutrient-binding outer membrane lipoprotein [Pedobacter sp. MC2016-24]